MRTSYVAYVREQLLLPQGHLAYDISDTVDALDLSAFHVRLAKGEPRNQPIRPAMMAKALVYGYATGGFSSRKLASKLHEDVAFRMLAAGNFPAHRTLRGFRALHLKEFSELFVQVLKLARERALWSSSARLRSTAPRSRPMRDPKRR